VLLKNTISGISIDLGRDGSCTRVVVFIIKNVFSRNTLRDEIRRGFGVVEPAPTGPTTATRSPTSAVRSTPSDGFADYSQVDNLGVWYKSDNFGEGGRL